MSVLAGVERDLGELPEAFRSGGLAALATAMAERIDGGRGSPSECGKVLIDALTRLRELAPPEEKKGPLDELHARRALRLEGKSGASA